MRTFFVTGTDTGVGKTAAACALVAGLVERGERAVGLKPVASGCSATSAGLRNEDALALQAVSGLALPYESINPFAFAPAIAPHIAAAAAGVTLEARVVADRVRSAVAGASCAIIEGVGGWLVPLNARETMADVARLLDAPVVLVVGMRLGCLSHALLTVDAIAHAGLPLAGWIANQVEPDMSAYAENRATLAARIPAPCLGELPWLTVPDPATLAAHLDLDLLLSP